MVAQSAGVVALRSLPNKKILVADDDRKIVELAKLYLEKDGYHVIAAYDGRAALEAARREKPALVVLDLLMPEMDGRDVCRALRAVAEQAQAKEIAINSTVQPDLRVEVDAARIGQVLRNLLVNALAFTPPHGRVEIGAQPTGEWLQVSVSDSGVGIAAGDV